MGRRCFVPNCKGGYNDQPIKVSTFKAPSDTEELKKWQSRIRRKDRALTQKDCVCELHFQPNEILRFWEKRDENGVVLAHVDYKKTILKPGAVPSIFPNCPTERKPPTKRKQLTKPRVEGTNPSQDLFGDVMTSATTSKFKLPHPTWTICCTDDPNKFVTFAQILPRANGPTVVQKCLTVLESLRFSCFIFNNNYKISDCDEIKNVPHLEELLLKLHETRICYGGPDQDQFPDIFPECAHLDFRNKWRHNRCLFTCNDESNICNFCKHLVKSLEIMMETELMVVHN